MTNQTFSGQLGFVIKKIHAINKSGKWFYFFSNTDITNTISNNYKIVGVDVNIFSITNNLKTLIDIVGSLKTNDNELNDLSIEPYPLFKIPEITQENSSEEWYLIFITG
jgi:hypothetical protein